VIIYPTDSIYAFGCSLQSPKAIERLRTIKAKSEDSLSVIFDSISSVSEYRRVDNLTFKLMKRNLPGAFTFILNTSSKMPDRALEKRKCVGVRIPANPIARAIVERLGCPMITSSVKRRPEDDGDEYTTNPELIEERYENIVDLVVDGGIGDNVPTTLVDLTSDEQEILREGRGELR
jgi:tRNA threonylcarbamoyl adenosine modification protein (Sua5/YciO/YrdC/YwlC family)